MWPLPFFLVAAATFHRTSAAPATGVVTPSSDPCRDISGHDYVLPKDILACFKTFQFNETLRDNVLKVVSGVFDWYTFENYYLDSPAPFQNSTVNIRKKLDEMGDKKYDTDFAFNKELMDFFCKLNDGHTTYSPSCYQTFLSLMPTPVVNIEVNGTSRVYIAFNLVDVLSSFPEGLLQHYDDLDLKRYAGAEVLKIDGKDVFDFVDSIAEDGGIALDYGVRFTSVFSGYSYFNQTYTQRKGLLSSNPNIERENLTFTLIPSNSSAPEEVTIPYIGIYNGKPFNDSNTYWQANCAAIKASNGVDKKPFLKQRDLQGVHHQDLDLSESSPQGAVQLTVGLPQAYQPTAPAVNLTGTYVKAYILPEQKTGVLFVGLFGEIVGDMKAFQEDIASAINAFKAAKMERLLIDLSNNGGGSVCLGTFLEAYLAGSKAGPPGFITTRRSNLLSKKILESYIKLNLSSVASLFSPSHFTFMNGTEMPNNYNYFEPSTQQLINGKSDPMSQPILDQCAPRFVVPMPEEPPFDLSKVAIVTDGVCLSTCAQFITAMYEKYNTTTAVFGGRAGQPTEFKGTAGYHVVNWPTIDADTKTANLKNDPLAAPDLLVNAVITVNVRSSFSWLDPRVPIEYKSDQPHYHFSHTKDTVNNPQNVWKFAIKEIFGV